jgi:ABC-type nitrate/sulfonate/bicarbonate transport system substrate-binding protein
MQRFASLGLATVAIMALLVSACAPAPAAPAAQTAPKEMKKVTFGWTKQVSDGPLYRLPDKAKQAGIEIEMKQTPRYPDLLTALAKGDVDISSMGYPQAAQAVEQKITNVKFISGFGTGGTTLTMHKDVKVTDWKDLEGKKIGIFPGGPGDLNFRAGLAKNGVDIAKVNVIKMSTLGAPLYQALKTREIDGYVCWEPFSATPAIEGYAYYAPLDLWANDTRGVNQALAANTDWLAKNPDTAVALIKLINDEMIYLKSHDEDWARITQETLGLPAPVAVESLKHFNLDTDLPFKMKEAQAMARYMAQYGMAQGDFSAEIPNVVDYSVLEKATGKTKAQLGAGG